MRISLWLLRLIEIQRTIEPPLFFYSYVQNSVKNREVMSSVCYACSLRTDTCKLLWPHVIVKEKTVLRLEQPSCAIGNNEHFMHTEHRICFIYCCKLLCYFVHSLVNIRCLIICNMIH